MLKKPFFYGLLVTMVTMAITAVCLVVVDFFTPMPLHKLVATFITTPFMTTFLISPLHSNMYGMKAGLAHLFGGLSVLWITSIGFATALQIDWRADATWWTVHIIGTLFLIIMVVINTGNCKETA